jgi:asparagine synthase (glutamine-hydrolysing)
MKWLRLLPAPVRDYLLRFAPARVREKLTDCKSIDNFLLGIACRRWMNSQSLKEFGISQEALFPQGSLHIDDLYQNISDAEIHGYMEPMLLRDSDQMSMAVSLELRVPFLDHRLVSYVLGLSTNIKAGIPPKKLLIEAFKDVLPVQVWNRPKMGFTLPMSDWMKGPLKGIVVDGTRKLARVLNENKIVEVERKFSSGKVHWTRLWSLVVLGHYLDRT